ncbi:MAG: Txe/YoeB family addiction module toxin [Candidatus Symbiothrix sp.]|jgi:toxin YoeB|nr:Txe/YoeB family addiction module toxin [Candidatus Symbiothrix sp.]
MEIKFKIQAAEDIEYWKRSGNKGIQTKIDKLLRAIKENPVLGIGKPEQLKQNLSGYYSRRINQEHRIVYKIDFEKQLITVHSIRGHYE